MRLGLQPPTPEALELLMEGSKAMARISQTGIRIDVAYLENAIENVKNQISLMQREIKDSKEYRAWAKRYGNDMNLNSRVQLGKIIFDDLGYKRNPFMEGANSEGSFEHLTKKVTFLKNYFGIAKLKKALVTNLYGIQKETVDGYCHPFIDLHTAESYRSSSSKPNFANQPIRNKTISEIVRSCVIPRKEHVLLEADYNTMEVRGSYCYHQDPKLRHDILTGDMHTDRALDLFLLTPEELGDVSKGDGKMVRYVAKNKFVFAQFYGSVYFQCAHDLWDAVSLFDLKRSDGVSLFEHLKSKGIKRLGKCDPEFEPKRGTYEYHVKEVESKMWQETYTVYDQWKRDWWQLYQRQGGVNTLTGFRLFGVFKRNQILCDPIQGVSFHCLLWSIIRIQKELMRRKMKSRIINQIYDSILTDTLESERDDVIELQKRVMTEEVAKVWSWITIPLSVEFEECPENWFKKTPIKEKV